MLQITNPDDCCGCSACASICNHDAITMKPDALGFLYPKVDSSKCTDCGLCEKVCAFNDKYDTSLNLPEPITYGARHKDMDEVMRSRSGAVFAAISDYIIENGGVVYGAGYTDHFRVVHKRATTKQERDEFRGSKYVQSDMNTVFRQVKKDLKDDLTVLFSGTPCQISGLKSFIGSKLSINLILIDVVCHGTPSPNIWHDYVSYLEKEAGETIIWADFRDKRSFGWRSLHESFEYSSHKDLESHWFTDTFGKHLMLRHSCAKCYFTNTNRPSDITLADFWGWQKNTDINKDDKGLNLVLCNTQKGIDYYNSIRCKLVDVMATPDAYMQPNLHKPSAPHKRRMKFEKDYQKYGFNYVYLKTYDERPLLRQFISHIYQSIRKLIII